MSCSKVDERIFPHISTKHFIIYDGKGVGKEYDDVVMGPLKISGKLAYVARNGEVGNGDKSFLIYDGQRVGGEYYSIDSIKEINRKIVFTAKTDWEKKSLFYDGQKIGGEYRHIDGRSIKEINGKVAFVASEIGKDGSPVVFFVYDGEVVGGEYKGIVNFSEINGKLVLGIVKRSYYCPGCDWPKTEYSIVYNGNDIGKEFDSSGEQITNINGKLAFTATKNGKTFIVMEK